MLFLDRLRRKPTISERAELQAFMDSRAAFLTQKCIYEYSRARSGLLSSKLFKEPTFMAAVEVARWRNYPLCLESVSLMTEHALRPQSRDRADEMRQGLVATIAAICRLYPVPDGFAADFWDGARERITGRIMRAGLAAPRAVKDFPHEIAKPFFANLPIHADLRGYDFELVTNNLRVNLCRAYDDLIEAADLPALASSVVGEGARALPEAERSGGAALVS